MKRPSAVCSTRPSTSSESRQRLRCTASSQTASSGGRAPGRARRGGRRAAGRAPAGRCRRTSAPAAAARRAPASRPAPRRSGRAPGTRRSAACPATQTRAPSSMAATENRAARAGSTGASAAMSARSAAGRSRLGPPVHQPGHDPPHVGVDDRLRLPVTEAGDRPGGVGADAGQRLQRGDVVGDDAAVPLDDRQRRLPQPQRPAGVAELAPGADDVGRRDAARAAGVGQRSSHSRQTGSTRATGVCCSMTSLTSTAHASTPGRRHGRSRAAPAYQSTIASPVSGPGTTDGGLLTGPSLPCRGRAACRAGRGPRAAR